MKWIKTLPLLALATVIILFFSCSNSRQAAAPTNIAALIDSQQYTFVAQSVMPLRGRTLQLNSGYSLRVSKDVVDCYLPYFGRAFSAPINSEGGIKFKTSTFTHVVSPSKDKWQILITPTGVNDVQTVNLTVFNNGSATVQVRTNNRDAISYKGYVERHAPTK